MSESLKYPQPQRMETSAAAVCRKCGAEVYTESIIEQDGVPVERIVSGTFRQALDPDGLPYGPVIPFCKEH